MNINKYLPESRRKRFWKSLTNYNPLTFVQLFFNSKIKRMPHISSLSQEQRRQAALRRSRSQYANASQKRTRNEQYIALARTSNLEVAEEDRSRNSSARSQRRRSERIRASERLRNTDNRATWRPIEENRGPERARDAVAHGSARSNSEERWRQQVQNTADHATWKSIYPIPMSDDESNRETLLIMLPGDRSGKIEEPSAHGTL